MQPIMRTGHQCTFRGFLSAPAPLRDRGTAVARPQAYWSSAPARWLLGLLLGVLLTMGMAHAAQSTAQGPSAKLAMTTDHLVDPSGALTAAELHAPALSSRFESTPLRFGNGPSDQAHWVRLRLAQTGTFGDWVVALPTTAIGDVRFYGPLDAQGQALAPPVLTGLSRPFDTRPLVSERYAFRIRLAQAGEYTAYLRLASDTPQSYAVKAWETTEFLMSRQGKRLFDGICYGILLALLVYNTVLTLAFRDRAFVLYVLTCGFALLTLTSFNGHAAHYVFQDWAEFTERSNVVAPALWIAFGGLFAREFMALRQHTPTMDRVVLGVVGLAVLSATLGAVGWITPAQRLNEGLAGGGAVLLLCVALALCGRGHNAAAWYAGGQLTLFVAVVLMVLQSWGVLESPFIHANGLQLGMAAEMVVFAVALSRRIGDLRQAQSALEQRAATLAVAADTDLLSGLLNRTAFEREATAVLAQPRPHTLLLLDLDHFKEINDGWGHAAGDEVIKAVAQRLRGQLRQTALVGRLGGDEFVVLLTGVAGPAAAQALVERLQTALHQPIRASGTLLRVGSSVGIATAGPLAKVPLRELMRAADEAMYQAKRQGRAQYAFAPTQTGPPQAAEPAPPPAPT